jgi:hypothetical protein
MTDMGLIRRVADVMRRCDPEYCRSHGVSATTDDEWDDLLAEIEDTYDPTPWCAQCGAQRPMDCHCGPIAENN